MGPCFRRDDVVLTAVTLAARATAPPDRSAPGERFRRRCAPVPAPVRPEWSTAHLLHAAAPGSCSILIAATAPPARPASAQNNHRPPPRTYRAPRRARPGRPGRRDRRNENTGR